MGLKLPGNKIFIIGFMGSGKSTIGKRLANKLKWDFADTDKLIEEKHHLRITDIFSYYNEDTFREFEHNILTKILTLENTVFATGGGTPCYYDNIEAMRDNAYVVYLKMPPGALYYRLTNSKKERPLLKGMTGDELKNKICSELDKREPFYNKAHLIIDALNINVDRLYDLLKFSAEIL